MDIKPDNIAWSTTFQKFVFLDYGFCRYVQEPQGVKSLSQFTGTYSYASPQMKKIYFIPEGGKVDLYYNDVYCLSKSLKHLTNQLDHERNDIFQAGMIKYK